jgi:amphi-Trp domain-containing protein
MDTKPEMDVERDVEKEFELSTFVAELRRLADALEKGEPFEIEVDGETVSVPASAIFSVEYERSSDEGEEGEEPEVEEELEFQIKWTA